MNVVAYILAFSNLQALKGQNPNMKDVSLKIGNVEPLCYDLKDNPDFRVEDFKNNKLNMVGNVGMYLSENLREYCIFGRGSPNEEGVVISIFYKTNDGSNESDVDLSHRTIMIRRDGLSDDEVHPLFQQHIRSENERRNRAMLN
uniref:Uncharacterized protein n=1 Tax=Heliothis virescens TaxID=7102 RepID=A0A2A4J6G7_HELVI